QACMDYLAPVPPEAKIALQGVDHTIEQAGGKGIKADILFFECAIQGLRLCLRVLCGGRQMRLTRQALPRLAVVVDGLDIRGVELAIALTDELESAVVGEPGSDAALQGLALLGS